MADAPLPTTRVTLLGRLGQDPTDQAAWGEFVERYGRHILRWCRQWKLQDADAEDVTQDILVKLTQKLQHFAYDPSRSFRAWIKTVTQHAWSDFVRARHKDPGHNAGSIALVADSAEAQSDLERQLEEAFDRELLEVAMHRIKGRVKPENWEAFRLTAIEGHPGAEAAAKLGMAVAHVFVAKHRIQKMLREEVRILKDGD